MKHYLNKYNLINFSMFSLLAAFLIERSTTFLIGQMNLQNFIPAVIVIFIVQFFELIALTTLTFTILLDLAFRNAEFDDISNSLKSHIATWKTRRFCTQINVEPTMNESSQYANSKRLIIKKANQSLLTLTVNFDSKKAIAKWQLPPNSESQALMEELLPKVKRELNQIDCNYQFNDFIRLPNGRIVISEATKRK